MLSLAAAAVIMISIYFDAPGIVRSVITVMNSRIADSSVYVNMFISACFINYLQLSFYFKALIMSIAIKPIVTIGIQPSVRIANSATNLSSLSIFLLLYKTAQSHGINASCSGNTLFTFAQKLLLFCLSFGQMPLDCNSLYLGINSSI